MSRELVLKVQRLQIVEGEPMALQTSFLPLYFCKNILNEGFESKSVSDLLQKQCNIQFSRSDIWIESPIINRKERAMLGNPRLSLFLSRVRLTFNQRGEPVRFSRGVFRGDRVRLKVSDSSVFELDKVRPLG
jgi:GntR family transcriptional regulator